MIYREFCQLAETPLSHEEWRSTDETPASDEELQWRKGFEVLRAIRHKRSGHPTVPDLELIEEKTQIVVTRYNYRQAKADERAADRANADRYFPLTPASLAK